MATDGSPELQDFHAFLSQTIQAGGKMPSPEEALDCWRFQHPSEDDELAVHEALDALEAGEQGMPLEEFDRQFRQQHALASECIASLDGSES